MASNSEHTIKSTDPTMLQSFDKDAIALFLQAYHFHAAAASRLSKNAVWMADCLAEGVQLRIQVADEALLKKDTDSQAALQKYLEQRCVISEPRNLVDELGKLHVDGRISDWETRLFAYDSSFLLIQKRGSAANLDDSVYVEAYVNGLWPAALRDAMKPSLKVKGITLDKIMEDTRACAEEQDKWHRLSHLQCIRANAVNCQNAVVNKRLDDHNVDVVVFNIGDLILLKHRYNESLSKQDARLLGPYKIVDKLNNGVFRIQSLFNVEDILVVAEDRLVPFNSAMSTEDDLRMLLEYDDNESEVEGILSHRGKGRNGLKFKIHWKGFDNEEDHTWEPASNLIGNVKFTEYVQAHEHEMPSWLVKEIAAI